MEYVGFGADRVDVSPVSQASIREKFDSIEYLPTILYKNASRYKNLRTIRDDNGNVYHESWVQKTIDKSADDEYFTVTETEENRLDIVIAKDDINFLCKMLLAGVSKYGFSSNFPSIISASILLELIAKVKP